MTITAQFLKGIVAEARPIIERQMDDAKIIAGLRDVVSAQGGDWGALKALIKAHVEDDSDDASEGKRVKKIVDKADCTAAYADMLGLANMNENNFSSDRTYAVEKGRGNLPPHDPETGEVEEPNSVASLDASAQAGEEVGVSPAEPINPDPHSLAVHGGEPSIPSIPDAGAKNGGVARTSVDQGGDKPGTVSDADVPVFLRKSHEPSPPKLNPDCQKAANGEPCALSHSMASCSKCANAAMLARRGVAA